MKSLLFGLIASTLFVSCQRSATADLVMFFAIPDHSAIGEGDSDKIHFVITNLGPVPILVDKIELLSESRTGGDGTTDGPTNETFVKDPDRAGDFARKTSLLFTPFLPFNLEDNGSTPGYFSLDTLPADVPQELPLDFEEWTFKFRLHYTYTTNEGEFIAVKDTSTAVSISDTPEPPTIVLATLGAGLLGGAGVLNLVKHAAAPA